jgi:hypothetical protein
MSGQAMSGRSSGRVEHDAETYLARGSDSVVSNNDSLAASAIPHRVRAPQAEAIIEGLTERERAIVADVGRLRLLTGGQLQRLHFEASASGQRHGRRVLTFLTDRRVLARLARSIGGARAGSAGYVYTLDVVGQQFLHPGTNVRRPWLPSAGFVQHAAMVSECYVQLVETTRDGDLELLSFEAEPEAWRSFVDRRGSYRVLKPDAFLRVGLGEFDDRWALECDRSTEDIPRVLRKCQAYVQYWQTGKEAVFPRVLWVANRAGRASALVRCLLELPEQHRQLFAVCELGGFISTVAGGADPAEK